MLWNEDYRVFERHPFKYKLNMLNGSEKLFLTAVTTKHYHPHFIPRRPMRTLFSGRSASFTFYSGHSASTQYTVWSDNYTALSWP